MSIDAICPDCDKPLRLRDDLAGKKIKCPKCSHPFVVPDPANETIPFEAEEELPPPKKALKRNRVEDDEDDDDDDRPRKRRGDRDEGDAPTPMEPIVWVIIAILFPCGPIGAAIAFLAMSKAGSARAKLPKGEQGAAARQNLQYVIILSWVGVAISTLLGAVGLTFKLLKWF